MMDKVQAMPASANRLKAFYETTARPNLQKTLGLENIMQVPKISKIDGRGNYNLGIKEWNIFPEAESAGAGEKMHGLNITICTTAQSDEHGLALLKELGMPFTKTGKVR